MTIDRKAILDTAVCYQDEDGDYIVVSPLNDMLVAAGDSEQEAMQIFQDHLDEYIQDYAAGKVPPQLRPGRPSKGIVNVSFRMKPEVKEEIATIAEELGLSQGEALHYLLLTYKAHVGCDESPGYRTKKKHR